MVFIRRRYYFWLVRAYVKKWRRTILAFLLLGVMLFFALLSVIKTYIQPRIEKTVERIGISGTYTTDNLPDTVLSYVSYGLTEVNEKGEILPKASYKWVIENEGKKYIFSIKPNQYFHNGKEMNANNGMPSYKDVILKKIDNYTLSYELKKQYSPFLATISKPLLINGLSGLGKFKVRGIELNMDFVKTITLEDKNDSRIKKIISFYPTPDALKVAFALGEVDKAVELSDLGINNTKFSQWKNVNVVKHTNYTELVSLFYNNNDKFLSNKKLRQALNFATPQAFSQGERAYSPIAPKSIYYNRIENYTIQDPEIAKTLLSGLKDDSMKLEITTNHEYQGVAKYIQESWDNVGVKSTIKVAEGIPSDFQIFLYSFKLPKDPDQYTLWHSDQINNLTHYKNLRIDKFLEDGRTTTDLDSRIKIYRDFQKYILDDIPVSFLYFPYEYTLERTFR